MQGIWQDVRYSLRVLARAPAFALVAAATLALGIGANTAMFAVVNAVLLKPLPFKDADRVMLVHMLAPDPQAGPGIHREVVWSYPKFRTFLNVQHTFDDAASVCCLPGSRASPALRICGSRSRRSSRRN
jgi:hypothetical protein